MCSEASFATTIEKLHRAEFPCELVFGYYGAEALGKPLMYFFSGEEMIAQQRALTVLGMVPEDRMEFVLQMIENMALTMRKENETVD